MSDEAAPKIMSKMHQQKPKKKTTSSTTTTTSTAKAIAQKKKKTADRNDDGGGRQASSTKRLKSGVDTADMEDDTWNEDMPHIASSSAPASYNHLVTASYMSRSLEEIEKLFNDSDAPSNNQRMWIHQKVRIQPAKSRNTASAQIATSAGQRGAAADATAATEEEEDKLPPITVVEFAVRNGVHLMLPAECLHSFEDFRSLFSMRTWSLFSSHEQTYLKEFLPPQRDNAQLFQLLRDLFGGQNFFFGNDCDRLTKLLIGGHCHPQIDAQRCQDLELARIQHKLEVAIHTNKLIDSLANKQNLFRHIPSQPPHSQRRPVRTTVALSLPPPRTPKRKQHVERKQASKDGQSDEDDDDSST